MQEENKAIAEDKFQVQLAPVPEGSDLKEILSAKNKDTMKELNALWNGVPKGHMVQFKLKVARRKQGGAAAGTTGDNKNLATSTLQSQPT